jgi:uncharacterized ferritin-like protein (DUF455 family)
VRRFIDHEELARDRRFKRANSRNMLMTSLPDDVDAIVRLFEMVAPRLEERVRGTELESVYQRLGPAFNVLMNVGNPRPGTESGDLQLKLRLHGIFVGELQALEAAGRTVWDFPEAPWEFKMNMARQCWDEARHVQIYEKLMDRAGAAAGDYPESTFLFEVSCHDDPVMRVTGVNRCLEGLACDVFRSLMDFGRETGDEVLEQAVDYVLADELTHVRFGSDWVKEFTKNDPARAQRAKDFQREVDTRFSFGGGRRIAREDRLEAGFTPEELDELESIEGVGPKRDTLLAAAEVLRDRHLARQRGEEVPALPDPA